MHYALRHRQSRCMPLAAPSAAPSAAPLTALTHFLYAARKMAVGCLWASRLFGKGHLPNRVLLQDMYLPSKDDGFVGSGGVCLPKWLVAHEFIACKEQLDETCSSIAATLSKPAATLSKPTNNQRQLAATRGNLPVTYAFCSKHGTSCPHVNHKQGRVLLYGHHFRTFFSSAAAKWPVKVLLPAMISVKDGARNTSPSKKNGGFLASHPQ
jgi:hypothetical protein